MLNKLKELREANEEGFTLIELLVVIVIIGILAAIALPIFLNQQKAAIAAGVKADVKRVQQAVAVYLVSNPDATEAEMRNDTTVKAAYDLKTDSATYIIIKNNWNNYTVEASNTNVSSTPYTYVFNSATGKYTETP